MLAITPQQLNQRGFSLYEHSKPIPKCHRKFRTAFTALSDSSESVEPMVSLTSSVGFHTASVTTVVNTLYETQKRLSATNIFLVTSGVRWTHRAKPEFPGATILQVDCRHCSDPNDSKDLRGHVGRHPRIMRGLAASQALQQLVTDVKQFIRAHPERKLVIHLFCTSGQHRSVGAATMLFYFLEVIEGRAPMLVEIAEL